MRRFAFACLCLAVFASSACGQEIVYTSPMTYAAPQMHAPANNSSAQGVAEMQARSGRMGHRGGNSGYEGVGFSTRSADDAIRNCCYWGRRTPREIGVARGARGWFACVRYH